MKNLPNSAMRDSIEVAMQSFLKRGGNIKVLPPQEEHRRDWPEGDRWMSYELLEDFQDTYTPD